MALALLGGRAARACDDDGRLRAPLRHHAGARAVRSSRRRWRSSRAGCRSRCGAIRSGRSRRSPRCSGSAPVNEPVRLRRFAAGFLVVFIAMPLAYVMVEALEPAGPRPSEGDAVPRPRTRRRKSRRRGATKFSTPAPLRRRRRVRHQQHRGLFTRQAARDRACGSDAQPMGRSRDLRAARRRDRVGGRADRCRRGLAQLRLEYPGLEVQAPLVLPRRRAQAGAAAGARAFRLRAATLLIRFRLAVTRCMPLRVAAHPVTSRHRAHGLIRWGRGRQRNPPKEKPE